MNKERILSTAVFLVGIGTGVMANNAAHNSGAALAKPLTERTGASMPNNLQQSEGYGNGVRQHERTRYRRHRTR